MSNDIKINFRVGAGELNTTLNKFKQDTDSIYTKAVDGITKQNAKYKEQQKLIEQNISLLQKKKQAELDIERNILIQQRKGEIRAANARFYDDIDAVNGNKRISSKDKAKEIAKIEKDRADYVRGIKERFSGYLESNSSDKRGVSVVNSLLKEKLTEDRINAVESDKIIAAEEKKKADEEKKRVADEKKKAIEEKKRLAIEEKKQTADYIKQYREGFTNGFDPDYNVSESNIQGYINNNKNKGSKLFEDALQSSAQKNVQGNEQVKIIKEQIEAIKKKNQLETEAQQSIQLSTRTRLLKENKDYFDFHRGMVDSSTSLDDAEKEKRHKGLNLAEADREELINSKYSESTTSLKEQEKNSKRQTALAIEQIETIKQKANEQVKAVTSGDMKLADVFKNAQTDEDKLIANLTAEGVKQQKEEDNKGKKGFGAIAGLVAMDGIRQLASVGQMITQTQNGFDIIGAASNTAGRVIGGVLGGIIGTIAEPGGGTVVGAGIGSEIGGLFGKTFGDFEQRKALARQKYWQTRKKYNSITGSDDIDVDIDNMENVGISTTQYIQMQEQYAKMRGNRDASAKTTTDAIYLEKGYGVDQSSTAGLIEMQRSAKENNRDLANLIGGVLEKGKNTYFKNGDTTFLNEFLNKFISLQKELLKNQTSVATGTTMDIMSRFNRIGGEFATSDPRSQGLMSTINNAISNPSGDFGKALTMYAIRKAHPEISDPFELMKQMQKGVAGGNLQSIFDVIQQSGGADWAKKMSLSNITGLGNQYQFGDDLYGGLKKGTFKGKLDNSELSGVLTDLQKRAEGNTAPMDVNGAKIENGLLLKETFEVLQKTFTDAINEALRGAVIEMKDGNKIRLMSYQTITTENVASDQKQDEENTKTIKTMSNINGQFYWGGNATGSK